MVHMEVAVARSLFHGCRASCGIESADGKGEKHIAMASLYSLATSEHWCLFDGTSMFGSTASIVDRRPHYELTLDVVIPRVLVLSQKGSGE